MSYATLLVEKHGTVLLVTLNRPHALNAINSQLADELINAVSAADKEADVHSIVLTGSGKAFAAGADIKEMQQRGFPEMYSLDWFGEWKGFTDIRKPIIAAVAGYAFDVGFPPFQA